MTHIVIHNHLSKRVADAIPAGNFEVWYTHKSTYGKALGMIEVRAANASEAQRIAKQRLSHLKNLDVHEVTRTGDTNDVPGSGPYTFERKSKQEGWGKSNHASQEVRDK